MGGHTSADGGVASVVCAAHSLKSSLPPVDGYAGSCLHLPQVRRQLRKTQRGTRQDPLGEAHLCVVCWVCLAKQAYSLRQAAYLKVSMSPSASRKVASCR